MGAIEDHKLYGLKMRENANDGSDFGTPEADYRFFLIGEDGRIHLKDAADVVTDITTFDKRDATTAPAVTDDSGDGYHVGSRWLDTTNDKEYVCLDASVGAAVWLETTAGSGSSAPSNAEYVTYAANGSLSAERVVTAPASGGVIAKVIRKTADETVNGSAALQDDDHLLLALAANEVWFFIGNLYYTSNTTPDIKFAFTVPAGATLSWSLTGASAAGAEIGGSFTETVSGSAIDSFGGGANRRHALIMGFVANGANAGNLQLQWAQNTSNGSDTILLANSHILAWQAA